MMNFEPEIDPRELVQLHHEERTQHINQRHTENNWRIFWYFLAATLVWFAIDFSLRQLPTQPGAALVSVSAPALAEPPQLCPGDVLEFTYRVDGTSNGVVDIDVTLYRASPPPQTLIFSDTLRDILIDPVHQELQTVWQIPSEVTNPLTGQVIALTPGNYQRRVSVSTSSRNTRPTITYVDFAIRDNCP